MKNKIKGLVTVASAGLLTLFVSATSTLAAGETKATTGTTTGATDAFKEVGVTGTGEIDGLYEDLKGVVNIVMTLGAFWSIAFLVVAGMTLSGSGGNPQKRNAGIVALGMVLLGIFVIYKAYDIAGWATGIG